MIRAFIASFLMMTAVMATPPRAIPDELRDAYTLDGKIPVEDWYLDGTYSEALFYSADEIAAMMERIGRKETYYYGATDSYLYAAIEEHIDLIRGKEVAIMGSVIPWYESIILYYGGHPTTIEYNDIQTDEPRLQIMTVDQYEAEPKLFDVVLSISSFEHDGLGRYGDPLDPYGDLKAMQKAKKMLKPDGILLLAVPVGRDTLVWNAHRIYGKIRLPMLLKGWNVIKKYGFKRSDFRRATSGHQPVFVLSQGE